MSCGRFHCVFEHKGKCTNCDNKDMHRKKCPEALLNNAGNECKEFHNNCSYCSNYTCVIYKLHQKKQEELTETKQNEQEPEIPISATVTPNTIVATVPNKKEQSVAVPEKKDTLTKNEIIQEERGTPNQKITAYVDGSFNEATNVYGSGIAIYEGENVVPIMVRGKDPELATMRNVAGEILAARRAIQYAEEKGYAELEICYDYMGIEMWATNQWKANKVGTKAYQKLCNQTKVKLTFLKIKGHSGNFGNEYADKLAKKAAGIA